MPQQRMKDELSNSQTFMGKYRVIAVPIVAPIPKAEIYFLSVC